MVTINDILQRNFNAFQDNGKTQPDIITFQEGGKNIGYEDLTNQMSVQGKPPKDATVVATITRSTSRAPAPKLTKQRTQAIDALKQEQQIIQQNIELLNKNPRSGLKLNPKQAVALGLTDNTTAIYGPSAANRLSEYLKSDWQSRWDSATGTPTTSERTLSEIRFNTRDVAKIKKVSKLHPEFEIKAKEQVFIESAGAPVIQRTNQPYLRATITEPLQQFRAPYVPVNVQGEFREAPTKQPFFIKLANPLWSAAEKLNPNWRMETEAPTWKTVTARASGRAGDFMASFGRQFIGAIPFTGKLTKEGVEYGFEDAPEAKVGGMYGVLGSWKAQEAAITVATKPLFNWLGQKTTQTKFAFPEGKAISIIEPQDDIIRIGKHGKTTGKMTVQNIFGKQTFDVDIKYTGLADAKAAQARTGWGTMIGATDDYKSMANFMDDALIGTGEIQTITKVKVAGQPTTDSLKVFIKGKKFDFTTKKLMDVGIYTDKVSKSVTVADTEILHFITGKPSKKALSIDKTMSIKFGESKGIDYSKTLMEHSGLDYLGYSTEAEIKLKGLKVISPEDFTSLGSTSESKREATRINKALHDLSIKTKKSTLLADIYGDAKLTQAQITSTELATKHTQDIFNKNIMDSVYGSLSTAAKTTSKTITTQASKSAATFLATIGVGVGIKPATKQMPKTKVGISIKEFLGMKSTSDQRQVATQTKKLTNAQKKALNFINEQTIIQKRGQRTSTAMLSSTAYDQALAAKQVEALTVITAPMSVPVMGVPFVKIPKGKPIPLPSYNPLNLIFGNSIRRKPKSKYTTRTYPVVSGADAIKMVLGGRKK